jgi:hypothetical protein
VYTKGGKTRDIPLPSVIMKFLQTYVERVLTPEVGTVERLGSDIPDILEYRRPAAERPGRGECKTCSNELASFHGANLRAGLYSWRRADALGRESRTR